MNASQKILPVTSEGLTDQTVVADFTSLQGDEVSEFRHKSSAESVGAGVDWVSPLRNGAVKEEYRATFVPKPLTKSKSSRSVSKRLLADLVNMGTSTRRSIQPRTVAMPKKDPATSGKQHTKAQRWAYILDLYISTRKGQTILLAWLGICLMFVGGAMLQAYLPREPFYEMIWISWTFLSNPGTHTVLMESGYRIIGIILSLTGILYFATIMGFVVDGIRDKMDSLKKGKSNVAEEGHTLLLGWTDKSISLIRQICLANESEKGGVIVVLAENEKEALEAELSSHMRAEDLLGTQVVFRTGTPLLSVDLQKVAAHRARSVIIMANSTGDADRSDAAVLRTVLGLKTLPELAGHVVAELRDIDNEPLLRLVGGDDVEILVSHDVIGRLVLMAARSPGLARVFSCLLGFEGNEFYAKEWPEVKGVRFGDLSERFPNAIPLGVKTAKGELYICPDFEMVINAGDQILVLAEDDDTYKACPPEQIDAGALPTPARKPPVHERILMCGWRRDIRDMINLLDSLVLPGTELHMICEEPVHLRNKMLLESGLNVSELKNLQLIHHFGNTAIRRHLEGVPLDTFTSMMILADQSREDDIMHSDSHSLASLLLLRDLQMRLYEQNTRTSSQRKFDSYLDCKCIAEILDPRTQKTISTSTTILKLSEFIQSNELVSCILAMISESRDVRVILDELLGAEGAHFAVEPCTRYCTPTEQVSFWQLAKRAMTYNEILCGYQLRGAIEETVLNPTGKNRPMSWTNIDLIVLRPREDPVVHPSAVPPVQADDFERTSLSRMSKSSFMRQQVLEALVHEQELANLESPNGPAQDLLKRALRSYVELTEANDNPDGSKRINANAVRSLVTVAKLLVDALEKYEGVRVPSSDEDDEKVSTYDPKVD